MTSPTSFILRKVCQKRKSDPQPKIDTYFVKDEPPKKKPKKGKKVIAMNFQGYAVSRCRFRSTVGDFCYMPNHYARQHPPGFLDGSMFCGHCYLEPCFLLDRREEISEVGKELIDDHRRSNSGFLYMTKAERDDVINADLKVEIKLLLETIFSKRYVKKSGLPLCAKMVVDREHPPRSMSPSPARPVKENLAIFPSVPLGDFGEYREDDYDEDALLQRRLV